MNDIKILIPVRSVITWLSPAIEEVSAFSAVPAGMPGGFFGCCAVIDHPDFIEIMGADNDLV